MKEKGATILELVTVMGIFATLFGIISVNILSGSAKASIQSSLTILEADIKQQQILAISADADSGNVAKDHGVYFSQNSYTLFSGSSYSATASGNFVVDLGNNIEFSSVQFPSQVLIFTKKTGEVLDFNENMHTVTLKNMQSNETKTLFINKLGVLDLIQ